MNHSLVRNVCEGTADATCETMTRTHWTHHVILAAVRLGANSTIASRVAREKAGLWYRSGEPVWMAAESLLAFALAQGEETAGQHLARMRRACEDVIAKREGVTQ